ncbi:MAG: class I SAM-dependent methyltransferase [Proteobacteria bacterium]|nr:class I SAM-dependent methyltransferase [Pseudomonadota bacterium]
MRNPHFDHGRVVWSDAYSGQYEQPTTGYSEQFDLQWKIALRGNPEYSDVPGAAIDDAHIEDRVYEWTRVHPRGTGFSDASSGIRALDHPIDPGLIKGRKCVDIGCGMGRWTRTLQVIGAAEVLSIDISNSALESVKRFNQNTLRADITRLPEDHPELVEQFDFAVFWGVAMCTHDPCKALASAASLVRPGGYIYLMVYAPEGMHNTAIVNIQRRIFSRLKTVEERLAFVEQVYDRAWNWSYPPLENLKNLLRNLLALPRGSQLGVLDMLEPFYNWVIPMDVIEGWMSRAGFADLLLLNELEPEKCAYHVLARKTADTASGR